MDTYVVIFFEFQLHHIALIKPLKENFEYFI